VKATPGGRHPQWGTRNAIVPLGRDTYSRSSGPTIRGAAADAVRHRSARRTRLVTWAAKGADLPSLAALHARMGSTSAPSRVASAHGRTARG
jgi:hypothetical protein